ncbi:hypothetical protein J4464_03190, partial [Candidatus Woesearchaeota archaeon]|nr:hypothetical protein [Candidatus Woesearchaeota archaeon]
MNQENVDVLSELLNKSAIAVRNRDVLELRRLSDYAIQYSGMHQEEDVVSLAVIIFALSKNIERQVDERSSKRYDQVSELMERAQWYLSKEDYERYKQKMRDILAQIDQLDDHLASHVVEVIRQARIKKGSKLFEQGISLRRAAELLGISTWELMSYVGHTQIIDQTTPATIRA